MTTSSSPGDTFPYKTITLSGHDILYRQHGSGPPLLLIHGWGGSSDYWINTLSVLADDYTCYAFELPGYGKAHPINTPASAEHLAELIVACADALGLSQFHLNGHSFGSAVVAYIAARYPQRVQRLILTCFGTYVTEAEQEAASRAYYVTDLSLTIWHPWLVFWSPFFRPWQQWMVDVNCATYVAHEFTRPAFHAMPDDDAFICEGYSQFMCMDYRTSLESMVSLSNPELRVALQSLSVPTLFIGANQDRMVMPSRVQGTAQLVPNHRLAWIDECGHLPMFEQPDVYHQIVRTFLRG